MEAAMTATAMDDPAMPEGGMDEAGRLPLAPVLDLSAARPLHEALLARRGAAVVLDASGVERLGGQCLAVLLAAARLWRAEGHGFAFADPSEGFTEALALMGLDAGRLERGETGDAHHDEDEAAEAAQEDQAA